VLAYIKRSTSANRTRVIEAHIGYVRSIARKKIENPIPHLVDEEDLIAVGVIGLLQALEKYDKDSGYTFRSFSFLRIRGAMFDTIRRLSDNSRTRDVHTTPIEDINPAELPSDDTYSAVNDSLPPKVTGELVAALASLPPRQCAVILLLTHGMSAAQIGNILAKERNRGISVTAVLTLRDEALDGLRSRLQGRISANELA